MTSVLRRVSSALVVALRRALGPKPLAWASWLAAARPSRKVKRLSDGSERVYYTWRLVVPSHVAERLGLDPEGGDEYLIVLAAKPRWYHLLDPKELREHWENLPPYAKAEACISGLAPRELCGNISYAVVVGPREELRRHGLEPESTNHIHVISKSSER